MLASEEREEENRTRSRGRFSPEMISTRSRDRRRLLLVGLILSLLIHLFGGAFLGLFERIIAKLPQPKWASRREITQTDKIDLEKPVVVSNVKPQPQLQHPAPPRPAKVLPQIVPAPPVVHHEIAHIVAHAPPEPPKVEAQGTSNVPHKTPATGPRTPPHTYYSDEQVSQMTDAFSKTIASVHSDAQSVTAQIAANAHVVTMKHDEFHYNGIHEGMNPGDGLISYTKKQRIGNQMYYWTHYIYMYPDGHVEEDDIPWPFVYAMDNDELAKCDRIHEFHPSQYCAVHLQGPPEDYKPDRPLKPVLEQFFGGPPVG
jgi:hypothetical protein